MWTTEPGWFSRNWHTTLFLAAIAVGLGIDGFLLLDGQRTISQRVWAFEETLGWAASFMVRAAGTAVVSWIGWLCTDQRQDRSGQWLGALAAGLLAYHLFLTSIKT